jgi:hypothetical protein
LNPVRIDAGQTKRTRVSYLLIARRGVGGGIAAQPRVAPIGMTNPECLQRNQLPPIRIDFARWSYEVLCTIDVRNSHVDLYGI